MVVRKVVERLKRAGRVGVVRYAVFAGAVEILERMKRGLVVLFAWIATVGC